tara:strand:+ start:204 stop:602 length:399 start_codon:yes stop_codon:yes gene_type:complete
MNAWQKTKAVHMSVLSSDLKLIGFENRRELHLSCDLINIARGNCVVVLRPETSSIQGKLSISSERPIMNAEIEVTPIIFDQVSNSLKHNVGRPLQLIIMLEQELKVDLQGVLLIDKNLTTHIKDMSWILPMR